MKAGERPEDRDITTALGTCFSRKILPYRAHDNRAEGVIITYTDVTASRRAKQVMHEARKSAEAANVAKSRFLAAASHDLRQPLQSLVLLQELLARKMSDPECLQLLARQEHTLESKTSMLDGLLDINRIEANAIETAPASFALDTLLAETVAGLAVQATAGQLKLRHVSTRCHVVSDRLLLGGMLRNLLANALKYTERGGVLIGARRRGQSVRIEVWDSGIGIPADKLEAIFEPYVQLGAATVDNGGGLGLGLAIVRSLGDILGHKVTLRSREGDGPCHGSVFSITVPLGQPPADAVAPPPAPAARARATLPAAEGARILIVDDEAGVRELLGQLLRSYGHKVVAACDDTEALASLEEHTPDLVISDFRLASGRDGLELAEALREALLKSHGRKVPVIMLTGDISIDALARFAANDIVRLSKPVRPVELQAAIAAALDPVPAATAAADAAATLVHVIDDDADVLQELGAVLVDAGFPVELHASAEAFRADWDGNTACCLLIDACLPGESGLNLLRNLKAAGTLPPSVVITGLGNIGMAVAAMKAGALDFIEKPAHRQAILGSIRRAIARTSDSLAAGAERDVAAARLETLTKRQHEVMVRVLDGQPSKIIAADLGLSQRTVEHHRAIIMQRTGCKSLPELARLVMSADPDGAKR